MPFSIDDTPEGLVLRVEGSITIRHAQELAAALGESLRDGKPAAVDTANLRDIDTCILQLLCSVRKAVPVLTFDKPSELFMRAVERCGLRRELLGARECS